MRSRSSLFVPLLAGVVLLGCVERRESETQKDGAVPPGAIPAAPDVRPGTESAPGNLSVPGGEPGQAAQQTDPGNDEYDPAVRDAPGVSDTVARPAAGTPGQ